MLVKLQELGCREMGLWRSYFSGRRACVVNMYDCVESEVVRGCPQGSICGPYIWNLMMDSLLERLEHSCAYADDLLVLVEGQSRADIERLAGECMSKVFEWGESVGVSVALDKTVMMLLKGKLSRTRYPNVQVNGVSLRYETEVKYLGIRMSERMGFLTHLKYVRERLWNVVGQVRRVLKCEWGLSRRAVRTMYGGLFVACATYGASVWYRTASSVLGYDTIISCQRVMMLPCLNVCRTVSSEAMQVLLGVVPLDLEVMRRAIAFKLKRGIPLLQDDWLHGTDVESMGEFQRKLMLKGCVLSSWQARWDNSEKGRVTYGYIRDVMFVGCSPDFGFDLSLGFLLTGHGSLNEFLHKRGLAPSQACSCGAAVEDWKHVLCECELYDDVRNLGEMGVTWTNGVCDVSGVLSTDAHLARISLFARVVFERRRSFR